MTANPNLQAIPPELNNYDWDEAFKYAAEPTGVGGYVRNLAGFSRHDVAEVLARGRD